MLLAVQEGLTQEQYGFGSLVAVLRFLLLCGLQKVNQPMANAWVLQSKPLLTLLQLMPEIPTNAIISEIITATLERIH